ncbi:hypothetical protein K2173_011272 [Erythroxylum novogranatense]|uniref:MATH domain-containing protein n=1 Tax=Erythroxylum novogranatense TaxID=1862640 RepID=A0AAV8S4N9_9ROSI|nr:hypothetical protein K2173_011272 [Erythroxylum novogranatense]
MYFAMGTQSKDSITELGIMRTKRDFPPKDFAIRIKQFSLLAEKHEKYESFTFEAGGYKWSLRLYPKGNTSPPENGKDHISLYLAIQDTDSLPKTWEVNVDFKLFVFNQIENKYLAMKTVWGFDQFLPIGTFNDAFNGYLVDDTCVFGAEVLVIKPSGIFESIHTVKEPSNGVLTWKIPYFSKLVSTILESEEFTSENKNWRILLYPNGNGSGKGNSLSVYLRLIEAERLGPTEKVWANFELRVLNKNKDRHVRATISCWYTFKEFDAFGTHTLMPLEDLREAFNGFVVNDTLTVEAELLFVIGAKVVS